MLPIYAAAVLRSERFYSIIMLCVPVIKVLQYKPCVVSKCTITGTSLRLADSAFAAVGPQLWNSLPTHVRRLDLSLDIFHHKLQTYLTVRGTMQRLVTVAEYKFSYLLTYLRVKPNWRLSVTLPHSSNKSLRPASGKPNRLPTGEPHGCTANNTGRPDWLAAATDNTVALH